MDTPKIVTSHIFPPIPTRVNDWCAHYEGEEEAGNYGWGRTQWEAVVDFIDNYKEDHDKRLGIASAPTLAAENASLKAERDKAMAWAKEQHAAADRYAAELASLKALVAEMVEGLRDADFGIETTVACLNLCNGNRGAPFNTGVIRDRIAALIARAKEVTS